MYLHCLSKTINFITTTSTNEGFFILFHCNLHLHFPFSMIVTFISIFFYVYLKKRSKKAKENLNFFFQLPDMNKFETNYIQMNSFILFF